MGDPSSTRDTAGARPLEVRADLVWRRLRIDRLAGGRQYAYVVAEDMRRHESTVRAFKILRWLLAGETLVGVTAIVIATWLATHGVAVSWAVWFRATVVLLITLSLYVFAWRAQLGYYWAFARLRLFSRIFPVVTVVIALIPGLYPEWMVVEQLIFSALMIAVAVLLSTAHLRGVFPRRAAGAR